MGVGAATDSPCRRGAIVLMQSLGMVWRCGCGAQRYKVHQKMQNYERGVADYSMPRLWESYVQYSQKRYAEREDGDATKPKLLNDARLVAERALACVGTHYTGGSALRLDERLAGLSGGSLPPANARAQLATACAS